MDNILHIKLREFETKGVTRIRKSKKNRQHNGQQIGLVWFYYA